MTILTSLSYGKEIEYQRVVLAILSFWGWYRGNDQVKTVLFTDNPEYFHDYFAGLDVEYVLLTAEKIQEMKNKNNYFHQVKVEVINETFAKFPGSNLLFVDSDTFFTDNPATIINSISPETSFMHEIEFTFEEKRHTPLPEGKYPRAFLSLIESKTFTTSKGTEKYHAHQLGWNSGVLGLSPTVAQWMPDVYHLTNEFYQNSSWHISEQLAFSVLLQTRGTIRPSADFVYHYWPPAKKKAVDAFLSKHISSLKNAESLQQRVQVAQELTQVLPNFIESYFKEHPEMLLLDQAMYYFNTNNFSKGYQFAFRVFLITPMNKKLAKDVLYHVRRHVKSLF